MFVLIIEKRISSKIKKMGDPVKDWYVLMAAALPFEPSTGLEIELKGESNTIELTRVVFRPTNGTFWAETKPVLHPRPDTQTVAQNLVDNSGWDVAVKASDLPKATIILCNKAIEKLVEKMLQATSNILSPGMTSIRQLGLSKGIRGRKT